MGCGITSVNAFKIDFEDTYNTSSQADQQISNGLSTIQDQDVIEQINLLSDSLDSSDDQKKYTALRFLTEHAFDVTYVNPIHIFSKFVQIFESFQGVDLREVRQVCYIAQFILFQVYVFNHERGLAPIPEVTRQNWEVLVKGIRQLIQKTESEQNGLEFLISVLLDGISLLKPCKQSKRRIALGCAKEICKVVSKVVKSDYSECASLGKEAFKFFVNEIKNEVVEELYVKIMGLQYLGFYAVKQENIYHVDMIQQIILNNLHSNWKVIYAGIDTLQYILESTNNCTIKMKVLNNSKIDITKLVSMFTHQREAKDIHIFREWRVQEKLAELLIVNCNPDIQKDFDVQSQVQHLYKLFILGNYGGKVNKTITNPVYVQYLKQMLHIDQFQKHFENLQICETEALSSQILKKFDLIQRNYIQFQQLQNELIGEVSKLIHNNELKVNKYIEESNCMQSQIRNQSKCQICQQAETLDVE